MKLKLKNTAEDMLVFGSISSDSELNNVLAAGDTIDETMWIVADYGSDLDDGAVAIKTLTSNKTYYVGWDGESFVGYAIAGSDGSVGVCALAGVFHSSFHMQDSASYDSSFGAPYCNATLSFCDSGSLVFGRGIMSNGHEPNHPNT